MKRISLLLLLIVVACGSVLAQNKALSLDGDGDYMKVADSSNTLASSFSDSITVSAWVNATTLKNSCILHKKGFDNNDVFFGIWSGGKDFSIQFRFDREDDPTPDFDFPFSSDFIPKTWYHFAAIFDSPANQIRCYVDGEEIATQTVSGKLNFEASQAWYIGIDTDYNGTELNDNWIGQLDEVRVWNVAKTQDEIQSVMGLTLTGNEDGLVGYWNFDDGTARDLSSNANDGELKGNAQILEAILGVSITDSILRSKLEQILGKEAKEAISKQDLLSVKELNTEKVDITDISGLEYATNLTQLNIEGNQITDLLPLILNQGISGSIDLRNNPLNNTALSTHIPQLKARGITVEYDEPPADIVTFKDNNLESTIRQALEVPTALLTTTDLVLLEQLEASNRDISDLTGLEHCANLTNLHLGGNQIIDIAPLADLTALKYATLYGNKIVDISPLKDLTDLVFLQLDSNLVNDVSPLSKLVNLDFINIRGSNPVSDISVFAQLPKLRDITLNVHTIEDISPLTSLENLTALWLNGNLTETHMQAIGNLAGLTRLGLEGNQVSDISALHNLTSLTSLILWHNRISNINSLSNLANLTDLRLNNNQIVDVNALLNLTNLIHLNLSNNQISDISSLSNLDQLTELDLTGNQIADLSPLQQLSNLEVLKIDPTPVLSQDGQNRVLKLTGAGDYVTISDSKSLKIEGGLTLEAMIHSTAVEGFSQIIAKGDGAAGQDPYFIRLEPVSEDVKITFAVWDPDLSGDRYMSVVVKAGFVRNRWFHLAGVLDTAADQMRLYLNGRQIGEQDTVAASGTDRNMPVEIGAIHATQFLGSAMLDEIRIWNRAREPEEIQADLNRSLTANEDGLVAYWNFDVGLAYDMTDNGNHGRLQGSASIVKAETGLITPMIEWSLDLFVSSLGSQVEVDEQHLLLGMSANATDQYDIGLDELVPPPSQSPVMLDAYLEVNDDLVNRLQADYHPIKQQQVYRLKIRADKNTFVLSWDVSNLPSDFIDLQLSQISPDGGAPVNMRHQQAIMLSPLPGNYYTFEVRLSKQIQLQLKPGWNMISLPGEPRDDSPAALIGEREMVLLPMYRWHGAGSSYQKVTDLRLGEGYWLLTTNPEREVLELPVSQEESYTVDLTVGWNMIGSVSSDYDFSDPQDSPDNSIVPGSLFEWKALGFSYQPSNRIEPGKGYWVLSMRDCQLTIGGAGVPSSPHRIREPETLIPLTFTSGQFSQQLEIGFDYRASEDLDAMDRPMPPQSPSNQQSQVWLEGKPYKLMRDIKALSAGSVSWSLQFSSPNAVTLSLGDESLPAGKELLLSDGVTETVLIPGTQVRLESGTRELTLIYRERIPEATALLQNYPNPFNPETWIPFELNQDSEVSLTIYDTAGRQIRHLDLGFQEAGVYVRRDRAIYWDGRTQSGEQVASGTYFYRLKTAGYVSTQKMIILK